MKLYYLARPERIKEIRHECHWLMLGDSTHVLVAVRWKDEIHEMEWAGREGVIKLPHPIFESAAALLDEHLEHIKKRFPQAKTGDTIHSVLKHVAKEDPWMRLHVL